MSDKQSKNITKVALMVVFCVLIGEGVLGLGFFWPFLLILLDWQGIYWLSMAIGILISVIYRIPIGLPSLFLVVVAGGLSLVFSSRKETGLVILCVSLLANFVFDKVFGLPWNFFDLVSTVIAWLVAVTWFERGESIKLSY
ncbi:TPA: hypothetical protein DCZ81_04115 [Candidatus Collierbacteria bacterium]|nr:hypothetical protein [Candidatus Collierbacteria bacterium]HCX25802.1 hypothetical protein [Candidatus Collierbacteria bacterium]